MVKKKIYILLKGLKLQSLVLFDPILLYMGGGEERKELISKVQQKEPKSGLLSSPGCAGALQGQEVSGLSPARSRALSCPMAIAAGEGEQVRS